MPDHTVSLDHLRAALGADGHAQGLGVDVDEDAVADSAARYRTEGQCVPWHVEQLAKEER